VFSCTLARVILRLTRRNDPVDLVAFREVKVMWFAKWFGGRNDEVEDTDEPARFAATPTRPPQQSALTVTRRNKARPGAGFDPYNSGAFEKRNAWEKVSKR
jgi:hypothetical protein